MCSHSFLSILVFRAKYPRSLYAPDTVAFFFFSPLRLSEKTGLIQKMQASLITSRPEMSLSSAVCYYHLLVLVIISYVLSLLISWLR